MTAYYMTIHDSIAGGFGHDAAPRERSNADFMGMCQVMIDFHLKWWQTDTSCRCSCLAFQFHVCVHSSKRAILLPSLLPSCLRAWVSWVLGEHVCTVRAPRWVCGTSHTGVPGNRNYIFPPFGKERGGTGVSGDAQQVNGRDG